MRIWRSLHDDSCRRAIVERFRKLRPDAKARWGRMDAPRMVAHLTDQMRHCLGDSPVAAKRSPLRWPPVRWLSIYVIPWPRGRIHGPPEAFTTRPTSWDSDVEGLLALVERFAARDRQADWPDHALFGRMTGRSWGVFVHKHFDYHLRQFGA